MYYSVKRAFVLSLCSQSCCPWRVQLQGLATLISALHSFLWSQGHPGPVHGDRESGGRKGQCFAFQGWQSHLEVAMFHVCAQPRAHQTPLAELSANLQVGCIFYCYDELFTNPLRLWGFPFSIIEDDFESSVSSLKCKSNQRPNIRIKFLPNEW